MNVTGHPLDDPQGTHLAIDGNPATFWQTDRYANPRSATSTAASGWRSS